PSFGFEGRDIGGPGAQGSWGENQDLFSINGSGRDIYDTADSFFFVYTQLNGDFQFVGRITDMDNTNPWAKAGFMARESLSAAARNVFVFRNPGSDAGVQYRTASSGTTTYVPGGKYEQWLRLVRSGNTFSGYRSADKANWTLIGSTTMVLPAS